ncbi:uncharacterized protein LOC133466779 isoform X2 [Phyllopteryx taeniolatus]|uniref:uncharacterized protein LOC133466779 isoform X2 n=1 Tax=Phyllopteryx taeniolatus TaxID=161469 RepID=UPI002AD53ECA|nr:uncharacterized protein LOC133466779 isoform X2 [Phyllopteryx taeniolatus]
MAAHGGAARLHLRHTSGCAAMILLGPSLCLPSQATVQELFLAARDANVVPDISLDPVLTAFLCLDSSAALQHQYASLQRSLSEAQQAAFGLRLNRELGGGRVTRGGVGVVALALSLLLDHVAQQFRGNSSAEAIQSPLTCPSGKIFGIAVSSRIGGIAQNYLNLIPGIANDQDMMAETTEIYDNWLKLEMLDHYQRMTNKKRMSSVSMQQWLTGAALHLHMRIHQVRLHSVPFGSAESLRLSYKTALNRLVQGYVVYLHRNIRETAPSPPQRRPSETGRTTNWTRSSEMSFNMSQADTSNETTRGGARKTDDFASKEGLLVIEPGTNVSHGVRHHPCESPAIQQALVTRIINAQDLEQSRSFFLYPKKVFQRLLAQEDAFELTN